MEGFECHTGRGGVQPLRVDEDVNVDLVPRLTGQVVAQIQPVVRRLQDDYAVSAVAFQQQHDGAGVARSSHAGHAPLQAQSAVLRGDPDLLGVGGGHGQHAARQFQTRAGQQPGREHGAFRQRHRRAVPPAHAQQRA